MSECRHTDVRRSKRVIDGEVHILCDECFATWDADISPIIHAAPEGPIDERRMAADIYELFQLASAHHAAKEDYAAVGRELRAQIWMVRHRYLDKRRGFGLSWDGLADAMGIPRHRIRQFASYNPKHASKGEPEYVPRPIQRQLWIAEAERRKQVDERHRAALRALGIARQFREGRSYDADELEDYAEQGSISPEQGDPS